MAQENILKFEQLLQKDETLQAKLVEAVKACAYFWSRLVRGRGRRLRRAGM